MSFFLNHLIFLEIAFQSMQKRRIIKFCFLPKGAKSICRFLTKSKLSNSITICALNGCCFLNKAKARHRIVCTLFTEVIQCLVFVETKFEFNLKISLLTISLTWWKKFLLRYLQKRSILCKGHVRSYNYKFTVFFQNLWTWTNWRHRCTGCITSERHSNSRDGLEMERKCQSNRMFFIIF